ncbi:hypothetical protein ACIA78_16695 [Streptomyces xanthochromogenes]|uniref:hypothetical protein n=1 Tax=Streptomyces xanthochromogenes TaxID=67384 RepID=UPI00378DF3C9
MLIDAQMEFHETILSLHELLGASKLSAIRSADSIHRKTFMMNALKDGVNDSAVAAWESERSRRYSEAMGLGDRGARDSALAKWNEEVRDGLAEIIKDAVERDAGFAEGRLNLAIRQVSARPTPDGLIRNAVLLTLVSAFEGVIGKIYRVALAEKPELYLSGEREYSLAEIVRIGSLDSIVEEAIERKVDTALRGGVEDWEKVFVKIDVHFKKLCIDWERVIEIFQRRNALVHTHGEVNATYASKVKNSPGRGTPLMTNDEYLSQAISEVVALGSTVIMKSWLHIYPDHELAAAGAPYLYFDDLLERGYCGAVERVADEAKNVGNDLDMKLRIRLYMWLARRNARGVKAIRSEVEKWDTSALKSEFSFSRAILLEDLDAAEEIKRAAALRSEEWVDTIPEMAIVKFRRESPK